MQRIWGHRKWNKELIVGPSDVIGVLMGSYFGQTLSCFHYSSLIFHSSKHVGDERLVQPADGDGFLEHWFSNMEKVWFFQFRVISEVLFCEKLWKENFIVWVWKWKKISKLSSILFATHNFLKPCIWRELLKSSTDLSYKLGH